MAVIEGEAHEVDEQGAPVQEVVAGPLPPAPLAQLPVPAPGAELARPMDIEVLVQRYEAVTAAMERVMQDGVHYGTVPGVKKPSLLKPGAEVLGVLFQLAPRYTKQERYGPGDHYSCDVLCTVWHQPTGTLVAEGLGSCTTRETRYAYRNAQRTCPACGEPTIFKSKYAPKDGDYDGASPADPPGWFCWGAKGGCGTNYHADDARITTQETGKVANTDLPDVYNTVLKMACKRAFIAAVLNATGASALFTQDVEDRAPADAGTDPFTSGQVQPQAVVTDEQRQAAQQAPRQQPAPNVARQAAPPTAPADAARRDEDGGALLPAKDYLRDMMARWPGWDWVAQAKAAADHVYGAAPSIAARSLPDAIGIAERLYRVRKYLELADTAVGHRPQDIQAVWATVFDGAVVQPVFTASPEQQARADAGQAIIDELREKGALVPGSEVQPADDGSAAGPTAEEQAEADAIPFGDDA